MKRSGVTHAPPPYPRWYLTCAKELSVAVGIFRAIMSVPVGPESYVVATPEGKFRLAQVSQGRRFFGILTCALRLAIGVSMLLAGTSFLVYTIDLNRLLLQASGEWRQLLTTRLPRPRTSDSRRPVPFLLPLYFLGLVSGGRAVVRDEHRRARLHFDGPDSRQAHDRPFRPVQNVYVARRTLQQPSHILGCCIGFGR